MMKSVNGSVNKVVLVVAYIIFVLAILMCEKPMMAHAEANEYIGNAPTTGSGFIDISAKHLYYNENGDLCTEFYVYNGLNCTIYEISKLHLLLNNRQINVGDITIGKISGFTLAPGTYTTLSVIFNGKKDHAQGAVLNGFMSVQNTCDFKYY